MRATRLLFTMVFISSCLLASPSVADPSEDNTPTLERYDPATERRDVFLRAAIAQGLASDGVSVEQALALADEKHGSLWVPKCPICRNVKAGLRRYARAVKGASKQPPGLAADPWAQLTSKDATIRHAAMQRMVARYVKDGAQRFKMTPEQIKAMHQALEAGRKQGMQGLHPDAFGTPSCPSCDGSLNIL